MRQPVTGCYPQGVALEVPAVRDDRHPPISTSTGCSGAMGAAVPLNDIGDAANLHILRQSPRQLSDYWDAKQGRAEPQRSRFYCTEVEDLTLLFLVVKLPAIQ